MDWKNLSMGCGISLTMILSMVFMASCSGTKDKGQPGAGGNETAGDQPGLVLMPAEYMSWITDRDNNMLKEQKLGDLVYSVQFKPAEAMVCLGERKDQIPQPVIDRKLEEHSDLYYFDLKIEMLNGQGELLKQGLSSPGEYDQRVNYCAFAMQKDIFLVSGKDTVPCGIFHFERAYDVAPYSKFLLGFGREGLGEGDKQLIFNDRLFGNGFIKFSFSNAVISHPPKLKGI